MAILSLILSLLLVQISPHLASATPTTNSTSNTNMDYIKASCNATLYKTLCYTTLSEYASEIDSDPKRLASTALNVTLSAARSTSRLLNNISRIGRGLGLTAAVAVLDCIEEIEDSICELQDSIGEMGRIGDSSSHFGLLMSDIQTWVSAALTDEDTCIDGFEEAGEAVEMKGVVRRHVLRVVHLTSNALALINQYRSSIEH